jgi:putative component of toxin-antitoxin plasmid stabilization module
MKLLEVLRTNEFDKWLSKQPPKTRAIITARLDLLSLGHFGDHKRFDDLNGGNKNGQDFDIKKAKKIRNEILEGSRTIQKS